MEFSEKQVLFTFKIVSVNIFHSMIQLQKARTLGDRAQLSRKQRVGLEEADEVGHREGANHSPTAAHREGQRAAPLASRPTGGQ